jgi:hypothetical protein
MQVEYSDLVLVRIRRDAFESLFDAFEEPVAETDFAPVEPVAGSLEIQRCEAAEANGSVSTGGLGQRAAGL